MSKRILYGKIKVLDGKKEVIEEHAVFTEGVEYWKKKKILEIIDVKCVGHTNTSNNYTEVKRSDEKRNNITGAYE